MTSLVDDSHSAVAQQGQDLVFGQVGKIGLAAFRGAGCRAIRGYQCQGRAAGSDDRATWGRCGGRQSQAHRVVTTRPESTDLRFLFREFLEPFLAALTGLDMVDDRGVVVPVDLLIEKTHQDFVAGAACHQSFPRRDG